MTDDNEQERLIAEAQERAEQVVDVQELQRAVALGIGIARFLRSPEGDALIGRAEKDASEILEALAVIDPEDTRGIREKQTDLARVRTWQHWLNELVQEGKNAAELLDSLDNTD